jgi:hypothetical protein
MIDPTAILHCVSRFESSCMPLLTYPIRYVVSPKLPVVSDIPNSFTSPGIDEVYDVLYSTLSMC